MRWLLVSRCARATAIVAAYLLCLQSMGLSRLAFAATVDRCCCHSQKANCPCAACSKARAVESGRPFLHTCGHHPDDVAIVALGAMMPPAAPKPERSEATAATMVPLEDLDEGPPREVPTPPPLA